MVPAQSNVESLEDYLVQRRTEKMVLEQFQVYTGHRASNIDDVRGLNFRFHPDGVGAGDYTAVIEHLEPHPNGVDADPSYLKLRSIALHVIWKDGNCTLHVPGRGGLTVSGRVEVVATKAA